MSFRVTIHGKSPNERGFKVQIDRQERKILITFNANDVSPKHHKWLNWVEQRAGNLLELEPQPYWGFDDIMHKTGTKLPNCFYVQANVKKINGKEYYHYNKVLMLQTFNFNGFLDQLENGNILVDFDARTGHNHGTKFRMRQNCLPFLYEKSSIVIDTMAT